jgi:membrane protease YdiL (CAAX protease family)
LKELWVIKYFHLFSETTFAYLNALAKVLVWIVPAWSYVKYFLNTNPMDYFNMKNNIKKGLFWGFILSLLFGLWRFIISVYLVKQGKVHFLLPLDSYIDGFLLVGITEEMVFRGLILTEINKRISFWKANVVTALLFLFIHYPIWIYHGTFFHFGSHVFIFLLGLIFGYIYKKTGSLWSVVILHSFYDFFIYIF